MLVCRFSHGVDDVDRTHCTLFHNNRRPRPYFWDQKGFRVNLNLPFAHSLSGWVYVSLPLMGRRSDGAVSARPRVSIPFLFLAMYFLLDFRGRVNV